MILFTDRTKVIVLVVFVFSMLSANCSKVSRFVESSKPYHTETYEPILNQWTRHARIQHGLEVELIAAATFKSKTFRRAYADEYAQAYKLTQEEKSRFMQDQLRAADSSHEVVLASFVPEKKWDTFDKPGSMWKLYLVNDNKERVSPLEVRRIKRQKAVTSHFFPYVTPWKSVYVMRFPCRIPGSDRLIIGEKTKEVTFVITSVLGSTEMHWGLE